MFPCKCLHHETCSRASLCNKRGVSAHVVWLTKSYLYATFNIWHRVCHLARITRSSSVPLLSVPFRRTSFARRSFSTAAPSVLNCDSLSLLSNQDLKLISFLPLSANYSTYLFCQRLCSRVTALWRYINFVLLLLLLLLHVFHAACRIPVVFAHWNTGANSFLSVTLTSKMTYIVSGGALNSTHSLTVFDGKFATYRTTF